MSITALLDLKVKAESLAEVHGVINDTLAGTRAFDGNLGVEVVTDVNDETHILVIEHWESEEKDAAYRAWRATDEGRSSLGTILAGPPTLAKYTDTITL